MGIGALPAERSEGVTSTSTPHDDLDRQVRAGLAALAELESAEAPADAQLGAAFDAMAGSRLIDIHARRLREHGQGHYTIGSSGHESNAYVAAALRPTDPALLHYRSGGFFLARTMQAGRPLEGGVRGGLFGMLGRGGGPGSGGRHKGLR